MNTDINPRLRALIMARGAKTDEEIARFIDGNKGIFHSPMLLSDMDKASIRIRRAIDSGERVMIIGDSDTDGITATAILLDYLNSKGVRADFFIPKNGENGKTLQADEQMRLLSEGYTLVITVDMGISSCEASLPGLDIIITDHHECRSELPECYAIIDPKRRGEKYPFSGLSGAGVALKLICAVDGDTEKMFGAYCDLVAIGTIADAMPLIDENRNIVKSGLDKLNLKMRPAISALLKTAGFNFERQITASVVGFVVAPRINAAGRIDRSGTAVEMLLSQDYDRIKKTALMFADANRERQQLELVAVNEATELIDKYVDTDKENIIVLRVNDWQQGIAGIVASRIVDRYSLPCVIVSFTDGIGRGSARSTKGFNLFSLLEDCRDLLMEFGGHELAAGITVADENYEEVKKRLIESAARIYNDVKSGFSLKEDAVINAEDINADFARSLNVLEPFGSENPQPVFLCRDMAIDDIISLANDRHLKFSLEKDGRRYTALYFGRTLREIKCTTGDVVNVYFAMDVNTSKNKNSLQLIIKKIDISPQYLSNGYEDEYERFMAGQESLSADAIPDKTDVISVYSYLMRLDNSDWEERLINPVTMARYISRSFSRDINYAKLMLSVNILSELKMARYKMKGSYLCALAIPAAGKINISESPLWRRLKGQNDGL